MIDCFMTKANTGCLDWCYCCATFYIQNKNTVTMGKKAIGWGRFLERLRKYAVFFDKDLL